MSSTAETMLPSRISVPSNLPELVKNAFNRARASGDVNFYPTQVRLLNINSIPFQLRYAPSLLSKPKAAKSTTNTSAAPFDPFDNPPPPMLICPLAPSHILALNKFAIVPEHFILATKEHKHQEDLLESSDLEAAYACVQGYEREGKELFVFFNSGNGSGASQAHRHLQLLEVENMKEGLDQQEGWDLLIKKLGRKEVRDGLPFKVFVEGINRKGEGLREVYLRLYREGCKSLGVEGNEEDGRAKISYNLGMTRDWMVLMPRIEEGREVRSLQSGEVIGKLALNGTVLAGTALVKSSEEWEALKGEEGERKVREVLERIGVVNRVDAVL
ncbi:bifunctional AP-4-A phosphorylase/ADP sulfurylase [Podospora fimiseda]|uniref:Bifunctional AP-4-A phosphorylase/ADP sulfurylase n=1 Tax=Podospora fimiseda TaxID=252190 RepID=A0AAN7GNM1_9PEZI|nr:bifunctional AP-4-A phosphorylase/ADP sulfurylase [Podospora fimiseda]